MLTVAIADAEEFLAVLNDGGFQCIEITLFTATAFLPEFNWEDEALRSTLIEAVSREIEPVVQRYRHGDSLVFPTSWNIAVAYK